MAPASGAEGWGFLTFPEKAQESLGLAGPLGRSRDKQEKEKQDETQLLGFSSGRREAGGRTRNLSLGDSAFLSGCRTGSPGQGSADTSPSFAAGPAVPAGLRPVHSASGPLQPRPADPGLHGLLPGAPGCPHLLVVPAAPPGRPSVRGPERHSRPRQLPRRKCCSGGTRGWGAWVEGKGGGGSMPPPPDLGNGVVQLVWTSKGGGTTEGCVG